MLTYIKFFFQYLFRIAHVNHTTDEYQLKHDSIYVSTIRFNISAI